MTGPAEIEAGLSELFAQQGMSDAVVSIVGAASTGAVRSTLLIDIATAGQIVPAVAQITQSTYASDRRRMTIEDEAALITLAGDAGIPTAAVLAASVNAPGLDAPVLVTRRVEGETIPRRVLRLVESHDGAGENLAAQCGEVMAALHRVDLKRVPERVERFDTQNPAEAYVASLLETLEDLPDPHPVLRYGINWLTANLPTAPAEPALLHGDLRNGNIIVGPDATLSAVIDWEVAHVGDPMEDLAYLCLRTWRFGSHDLEVGGFGSLASLRDAYIAAGGTWRNDAFDWWTAARTAWWGIGLAGQAAAFAQGMSASIVHAASGRRVVELEYDLLRQIG